LTCDVLVADKTARFCFPELRLGIVPGFGGIPRLRRELGNAVVRDILMTGRSLNAKKAQAVGLVSQVVAPGNVDKRPLLPSFLYLPHPEELPEGALRLPWSAQEPDYAVGEVARKLGEKSALRLVSSSSGSVAPSRARPGRCENTECRSVVHNRSRQRRESPEDGQEQNARIDRSGRV